MNEEAPVVRARRLVSLADRAFRLTIDAERAEGKAWGEMAKELNVSRQALHTKYAHDGNRTAAATDADAVRAALDETWEQIRQVVTAYSLPPAPALPASPSPRTELDAIRGRLDRLEALLGADGPQPPALPHQAHVK